MIYTTLPNLISGNKRIEMINLFKLLGVEQPNYSVETYQAIASLNEDVIHIIEKRLLAINLTLADLSDSEMELLIHSSQKESIN